MDNLDVLVDGGRAELEEETGQGGAAGAAVEPQDDGVVLGVVARLKEPFLIVSFACCVWLCAPQNNLQ